MSKNIFVYGTLKQNEPNWPLMEKVGGKFLGNGKTCQKYPLVIGTQFNLPVLLDEPGMKDVQKNSNKFLG